ncbi:hypothetical protein ACFYNO_36865 [Kitasatospora sp. NPDC006697]|uniref:hypothetical protein n=1 Tax=Kitasatospora sp. NPDC006697 TaxID=3364020 RepID=UPI0036C35728
MTDAHQRRVYRIEWLPGGDLLDAHCFCGARTGAPDPVAAWSWLLDHPRHQLPPTEGERR